MLNCQGCVYKGKKISMLIVQFTATTVHKGFSTFFVCCAISLCHSLFWTNLSLTHKVFTYLDEVAGGPESFSVNARLVRKTTFLLVKWSYPFFGFAVERCIIEQKLKKQAVTCNLCMKTQTKRYLLTFALQDNHNTIYRQQYVGSKLYHIPQDL